MKRSTLGNNRYNMLKILILALLSVACFYASFSFAAGTTSISGMAENIRSTFESVATLITAGSYVAGLGFAVAAILKFKAHKDNPTQIPIGTPVALLFVAAALLFLPTLFKAVGSSVFGTGAQETGISGVTSLTS